VLDFAPLQPVACRTAGSHSELRLPKHWQFLFPPAGREEVEQNMRKAIAFHLDGLGQEGEPVPQPHTYSVCVELPA